MICFTGTAGVELAAGGLWFPAVISVLLLLRTPFLSVWVAFVAGSWFGEGPHPTAATMSCKAGYTDADSDERETSFLVFICREMYMRHPAAN